MSDRIIKLKSDLETLKKKNKANEERMTELLINPLIEEFFEIFCANESTKRHLKETEQRLKYETMNECQHAFVMTRISITEEDGRVKRTPIYYCVKCGLTNEYDVEETSDLMEYPASQMGYIYADTASKGFLLSGEVISVKKANEIYDEIITTNPNISHEELRREFVCKLSNRVDDCKDTKHKLIKKT